MAGTDKEALQAIVTEARQWATSAAKMEISVDLLVNHMAALVGPSTRHFQVLQIARVLSDSSLHWVSDMGVVADSGSAHGNIVADGGDGAYKQEDNGDGPVPCLETMISDALKRLHTARDAGFNVDQMRAKSTKPKS